MGKTSSKYGIPVVIAGIVLCLACLCCTVILLYTYGDAIFSGTGTSNPTTSSDPLVPADTSNLPEWTIIVYSDGDDDVLEQDLWFDVNEMEMVGSNAQMNIVVQFDRAAGYFDGDGDWSDTRRFLLTQDSDLFSITSPVVESIGEADMGDPQTLVDFVSWSIKNYPAKKYALIMSDHGGGWSGGFSDIQTGTALTMPEIVGAIQQVQQNMGGQKFEVVGFDACLMGMIEVYGALYPYSNYMIASEETIPATGWSYAAWMSQLAQNPTMDGRSLSQAVVSTYIVDDVVLTQGRSAAEVEEIEADTTLSAIESAQVPNVISAMNQLITTLAAVDQSWVAQGREYTRSYTSLFGEDVPSPFIDLGHFSDIMATTNDPAIQQANQQLQAAISSAVIAEKHGSRMEGSSGISFHFPISDVYTLTEYDNDSLYAHSADSFLQQSAWDEFLAFHYTGQAFVPQSGQAFVPNRAAEIVAPGASEISIAPIQLSDTTISGDELLTLTTTVTGNPSYIYFILYFYNPDSKAYWVADTSYHFAPNTTTVNDVNSPDYGASPIQVEYEWDPSLFVLTDGQTEAFALFEPEEYINSDGTSTYSVYGQYTYANGGTPDDAKLVFDPDGNLLHIFALPDPDGDGISTAVAVTPELGDQFTDYVKSYYLDANGGPATYDYSLSSDVFTYGDAGFKFESRYPVDGQYAIGIYTVDFDNNTVESYKFITYQNQ